MDLDIVGRKINDRDRQFNEHLKVLVKDFSFTNGFRDGAVTLKTILNMMVANHEVYSNRLSQYYTELDQHLKGILISHTDPGTAVTEVTLMEAKMKEVIDSKVEERFPTCDILCQDKIDYEDGIDQLDLISKYVFDNVVKKYNVIDSELIREHEQFKDIAALKKAGPKSTTLQSFVSHIHNILVYDIMSLINSEMIKASLPLLLRMERLELWMSSMPNRRQFFNRIDVSEYNPDDLTLYTKQKNSLVTYLDGWVEAINDSLNTIRNIMVFDLKYSACDVSVNPTDGTFRSTFRYNIISYVNLGGYILKHFDYTDKTITILRIKEKYSDDNSAVCEGNFTINMSFTEKGIVETSVYHGTNLSGRVEKYIISPHKFPILIIISAYSKVNEVYTVKQEVYYHMISRDADQPNLDNKYLHALCKKQDIIGSLSQKNLQSELLFNEDHDFTMITSFMVEDNNYDYIPKGQFHMSQATLCMLLFNHLSLTKYTYEIIQYELKTGNYFPSSLHNIKSTYDDDVYNLDGGSATALQSYTLQKMEDQLIPKVVSAKITIKALENAIENRALYSFDFRNFPVALYTTVQYTGTCWRLFSCTQHRNIKCKLQLNDSSKASSIPNMILNSDNSYADVDGLYIDKSMIDGTKSLWNLELNSKAQVKSIWFNIDDKLCRCTQYVCLHKNNPDNDDFYDEMNVMMVPPGHPHKDAEPIKNIAYAIEIKDISMLYVTCKMYTKLLCHIMGTGLIFKNAASQLMIQTENDSGVETLSTVNGVSKPIMFEIDNIVSHTVFDHYALHNEFTTLNLRKAYFIYSVYDSDTISQFFKIQRIPTGQGDHSSVSSVNVKMHVGVNQSESLFLDLGMRISKNNRDALIITPYHMFLNGNLLKFQYSAEATIHYVRSPLKANAYEIHSTSLSILEGKYNDLQFAVQNLFSRVNDLEAEVQFIRKALQAMDDQNFTNTVLQIAGIVALVNPLTGIIIGSLVAAYSVIELQKNGVTFQNVTNCTIQLLSTLLMIKHNFNIKIPSLNVSITKLANANIISGMRIRSAIASMKIDAKRAFPNARGYTKLSNELFNPASVAITHHWRKLGKGGGLTQRHIELLEKQAKGNISSCEHAYLARLQKMKVVPAHEYISIKSMDVNKITKKQEMTVRVYGVSDGNAKATDGSLIGLNRTPKFGYSWNDAATPGTWKMVFTQGKDNNWKICNWVDSGMTKNTIIQSSNVYSRHFDITKIPNDKVQGCYEMVSRNLLSPDKSFVTELKTMNVSFGQLEAMDTLINKSRDGFHYKLIGNNCQVVVSDIEKMLGGVKGKPQWIQQGDYDQYIQTIFQEYN